MAATVSFPICLDPQQPKSVFPNTHFFKPSQTHSFTLTTPKPSLLQHKFDRFNCTQTLSCSLSSPESYVIDPLRTGRFLGTDDIEKLQILENFQYNHEFESGSLCIRVMRQEEMGMTVGLLSESFGESMSLPSQYFHLLGYLIKQYMVERRALRPHTATLIGFYKKGNGEEELGGTVEISFDKKGANSSPPSPTPPKSSPYICNMTVRKTLRRRGIGWHLLKASEELISQMSSSREIYLHCRMIDAAPFNMYTKAGYNIIKTDNIFILLTLQRRKHLMCKTLPVTNNTLELDISRFDDNLSSNSTLKSDNSSFDHDLSSNQISESDTTSFDHDISSNGTPE